MFRCYVLYRLCAAHAHGVNKQAFTVILQTAPDESGAGAGSAMLLRWSIDGRIESEVSPSLKLPTLWRQLLEEPPANELMYYLADGLSPDVSMLDPAKVRVMEVSSPMERRWKAFAASGLAAGVVDTRYMPLVTLYEMQHMRKHVRLIGGDELTEDEVRERYRQLGGTVRGVLVRSEVTPDDIINTALAHATSLDAVMASSTVSGEMEGSGIAHIPSTLVHFRVEEEECVRSSYGAAKPSLKTAPPFSVYEPVFASNHIRRRIVTKFHSRFVSILGEMVRTADLPHTSVLQGNLYEEFVHQRIQQSQANVCAFRGLDSTDTGTIDLCGQEFVEFDDVAELSSLTLQPGCYYKPISRSFGAVDFVLGPDTVGNMTLNLRHGISITALLRVVRAMGFKPAAEGKDVPVLNFYWLMPSRNLFTRAVNQPLLFGGRVIPPVEPSSASSTSLTAGQQALVELQRLVRLQQFSVCMLPSAELGGASQEEQSQAEDADEEGSMMDTSAGVVTDAEGSQRKRKGYGDKSGTGGRASKRGGGSAASAGGRE
jgi:hypothetical protein